MRELSSIDSSTLRGERFAVLQEIEGLSQAELSGEIGVSQAYLSKMINRERPVPTELAIVAADRFSVPLSFFTVTTPSECEGVATFRKGSRVTARQEKRVTRLLREAARFWKSISEQSDYREVYLPEDLGDPEVAACQVREEEGLAPEEPIRNLTRLMERRGIGVISQLDPRLSEDSEISKNHAGASLPSSLGTRPLVTLVGGLPGGVARLTLAHEFGHLIFDKDRTSQISSTRAPEEVRAFSFGASLLLPRQVLEDRISETATLHQYLPLKAEYGMTVHAIVMHAKRLGIVSPTRARSLYIQMSSMGWRKDEPVQIANEKPLLMWQAASRVWPGSTVTETSEELGVSVDLVRLWLRERETEPVVLNNVVDLNQHRQRRNVRAL